MIYWLQLGSWSKELWVSIKRLFQKKDTFYIQLAGKPFKKNDIINGGGTFYKVLKVLPDNRVKVVIVN